MNKRLLILAALALGVWIAATLLPDAQEKKAEKDANWPPFSLSGVTGIAQNSADHSFKLTKEQGSTGNWLITWKDAKPLRAETTKVDSLLDFIENHAPTRRLDQSAIAGNNELLAPYGLDKPQSVLTLEKDDSWTIALGETNPSGDGIYALSSLEPGVLLLDAGYAQQGSRTPEHYYDLRLLDMTADTVAKIRAQGAVQWEISRDGEEDWIFTWPEELKEAEVATHEASMYAYDLASLKGLAYAPEWSEPSPDNTVAIDFTVWRKGSEDPETLRLVTVLPVVDNESLEQEGEPSTAQYMATSSWQKAPIKLDGTAWENLHKTAFSLRERSVISINQGELERMELVSANKDSYKPLTADKGESLWHDAQGEKLMGMDVLLWRLNDLKYEGVQQDSLPDTARLDLTWNLWNADGALVASVRFYSDPELGANQCWVGIGDPEKFFPVDSELLEDLRSRLPKNQPEAPAAQGRELQETLNETSED